MTKTLLSFGHGYSAQALSSLLPDDWRIIGTTRSEDKAATLMSEGIEPRIWPGADLIPALNAATHLLISAGPTEAGDPVLNELRTEIAARRDQFEWVGYLSTTGVYGDHNGAWVDETTKLTPSTKRGQMRVDAEAAWQALGLPLHIFRLAGIYGPGRGPFAKVRNGTARRIIKQGQVFSRIHVDDIAQTSPHLSHNRGAARSITFAMTTQPRPKMSSPTPLNFWACRSRPRRISKPLT